MERARGRITAIHEDRVTVEVNTISFCSRCSQGRGCGAGLIGSDSGPRHLEVPLPRGLNLRAGDEVSLELAPQSVLHAALVVYGIPLAVIAVVGGLAALMGLSDLTSTLAMLAAGIVGVTLGRRRLRRSNCLQQFTPVIRTQAGAVR